MEYTEAAHRNKRSMLEYCLAMLGQGARKGERVHMVTGKARMSVGKLMEFLFSDEYPHTDFAYDMRSYFGHYGIEEVEVEVTDIKTRITWKSRRDNNYRILSRPYPALLGKGCIWNN